MTFFEIYPLIEVFDPCTQSFPNLSGGVVQDCDLVWWEKIRPELKMLVEIKWLQSRKVTRGYICS